MTRTNDAQGALEPHLAGSHQEPERCEICAEMIAPGVICYAAPFAGGRAIYVHPDCAAMAISALQAMRCPSEGWMPEQVRVFMSMHIKLVGVDTRPCGTAWTMYGDK